MSSSCTKGRFREYIRKNFFTAMVFNYWDGLSREGVKLSSLQVLKKWLDVALLAMVLLTWQCSVKGWTLWFCYSVNRKKQPAISVQLFRPNLSEELCERCWERCAKSHLQQRWWGHDNVTARGTVQSLSDSWGSQKPFLLPSAPWTSTTEWKSELSASSCEEEALIAEIAVIQLLVSSFECLEQKRCNIFISV